MKLKRLGIREFQRNLYSYLDKIPLMVTNHRTGEDVFMVLPPKTFEHIVREVKLNGKIPIQAEGANQ